MQFAALFACWQSAVMASGETSTGLNTTFTGIAGDGIQRPGDFLRMFGDGFERFRSVKMLAAGDEPDFELFEIDSHIDFGTLRLDILCD